MKHIPIGLTASLMKRYVEEGRSTPGAMQPASTRHMDPDRPGGKGGKKRRAKGNDSE